MALKKTRRACTKVAGCPAFQCSDHNCAAKGSIAHKPPPTDADLSRGDLARGQAYNTARWKRIRLAHLSSEPLCVRCAGFEIMTAAQHVDHVIPHRGDHKLFYDRSNLQSLCVSCHSFKTTEENKGNFIDYRETSV